jgi:transposase
VVGEAVREGRFHDPRAGELAERGLKVDYRTVWEFVHAEKLSYKKRR